MKTKFTSDEIAHIWANKSAPRGESPGAMSFAGGTFYSYGTAIARHLEFKGKHAVLINDTSYSVTTSRHQSIVRKAIPSYASIFRIGGESRGSDLRHEGKDIYEYAMERAAYFKAQSEKAKGRKDSLLNESRQWLERAKSANEFFGLRRKVDEKAIERLQLATAAAERKAKAAQAKRDAAEKERQQGAFSAWLNGETTDGEYFNARLFPVAFRVEGDDLVSTLGARVPLASARLAFRFAQSKRAIGWHRNGETFPVGMYQLEAINDQGIVAGCHRITWAEMERLSPVLSA